MQGKGKLNKADADKKNDATGRLWGKLKTCAKLPRMDPVQMGWGMLFVHQPMKHLWGCGGQLPMCACNTIVPESVDKGGGRRTPAKGEDEGAGCSQSTSHRSGRQTPYNTTAGNTSTRRGPDGAWHWGSACPPPQGVQKILSSHSARKYFSRGCPVQTGCLAAAVAAQKKIFRWY